MKKSNTFALAAASIASALLLSACGGGGGGGSTGAAAPATPASSSSSTTSNLTTPQYAADSAQLAAFTLLNTQRQACGFPAYQENTLLDTAAQAHAQYMATNNTITDTELSANAGFTGATFADRAAKTGYPSGVGFLGVSGGYYTTPALTDAAYGQTMIYGWLSGVYHGMIATYPSTSLGIGWVETTYDKYPQIWASLTAATLQTVTSSGPLTFPCQGTTGVAYSSVGETPTPPGVSGNWGTPIQIGGNPSDIIVLQTGTMTDTNGNVISLYLLNSTTDTNNIIQKYQAVAYPVTPLVADSTYSVSLTGTYNGTAFSRTFTFTTGNMVG